MTALVRGSGWIPPLLEVITVISLIGVGGRLTGVPAALVPVPQLRVGRAVTPAVTTNAAATAKATRSTRRISNPIRQITRDERLYYAR